MKRGDILRISICPLGNEEFDDFDISIFYCYLEWSSTSVTCLIDIGSFGHEKFDKFDAPSLYRFVEGSVSVDAKTIIIIYTCSF